MRIIRQLNGANVPSSLRKQSSWPLVCRLKEQQKRNNRKISRKLNHCLNALINSIFSIPNLAATTNALKIIKKKHSCFKWGATHEKEFLQMKKNRD